MTENEVLIKTPEEAIETIKSNMPTSGYQMLRESLDMAIIALKEIQQYREIGTVEECKELASMFTQEKKNALSKIVDEWNEYIEIGTVEECREAVEKQKLKKPVKDKYNHNCCPNCGWIVSGEGGYGEEFCPHCENCGQAIQWDENLEGMEE